MKSSTEMKTCEHLDDYGLCSVVTKYVCFPCLSGHMRLPCEYWCRRGECYLLKRAKDRLQEIAQIIERVDHRCMAYDGPVGDTREEMTKKEMRAIYRLATGDCQSYMNCNQKCEYYEICNG